MNEMIEAFVSNKLNYCGGGWVLGGGCLGAHGFVQKPEIIYSWRSFCQT
jgi:hypothetical protein